MAEVEKMGAVGGRGGWGSRNNYAQTAPLTSLYFQGRGPGHLTHRGRWERRGVDRVEKSRGYKDTTQPLDEGHAGLERRELLFVLEGELSMVA